MASVHELELEESSSLPSICVNSDKFLLFPKLSSLPFYFVLGKPCCKLLSHTTVLHRVHHLARKMMRQAPSQKNEISNSWGSLMLDETARREILPQKEFGRNFSFFETII
eukprot:TRINITY_DN64_c1_g1_i4.p1 TRINITY_DN64_c1_g1~~TRINITY_DN64_c1_g1_i4.p1  ORF type:complete len:110 (+),score=17.60 TRINITY_DN64_c1_g1_i4:188-517(+)